MPSDLLKLQWDFNGILWRLVQRIIQDGLHPVIAEVYRTPEQAKWNAERGIGSKNSLHIDRLAADILLYSPYGNYLVDFNSYLPYGTWWESQHERARWGGRFKTLVDSGHFSLTPDLVRR